MTTAFEQVKVDDSFLSQECEKQGCEVGLTNVPCPFYLIDMDRDKSLARRRRCDYLLIGMDHGSDYDLYVAPLELKSSGFNPQGVSKQLTVGAEIAEKIVPKVQCRFVPIVAHDGAHNRPHRHEFNKLAKHPVCFRDEWYVIKTMKCGEEIAKHLKYPTR